MTSHKINFTKSLLEKAPNAEKGKRDYYYDLKESGLRLQVTHAGSKTFYLYKRIEGKPEKLMLGKFPDLSIENARNIAQQRKGEIAQGQNPQTEKRKMRQELTLGDLFHEYMERYSKKEKKSWKYDEREIPKYLGHWFNRKISSIRKHEIMQLHEKVRDVNGLYQGNRVLERIRAMYNKAIEWGWEGMNPTQGIKKFKEKSRDRFILPNEFPFFLEALEQEENETAKDYIWLSLVTGARKTNVLMMQWQDINWENKLWRIPDTKNGEPLVVPLIPMAIDILKVRKAQKRSLVWVLDGEGKDGYFTDPKRSWNRIRNRATLSIWVDNNPDVIDVIKDCEATMNESDGVGTLIKRVRTRAEETALVGESLQVIGKSLGHKSLQSTQIYARLQHDPARNAMEKAVSAMLAPPVYDTKAIAQGEQ
jgi:integrase